MARLLVLALPRLRNDAGFGEYVETPPILSVIRSRVYVIMEGHPEIARSISGWPWIINSLLK